MNSERTGAMQQFIDSTPSRQGADCTQRTIDDCMEPSEETMIAANS
jgi:hypothetical protein